MRREELLEIAKPIPFNTEMVRAILKDQKSATRRIVKRQHLLLEDDCKHEMGFFDTGGNDWACRKLGCGIINTGKSIYHAPYQVDDILYVKETYTYGEVEFGENQHGDELPYIESKDDGRFIPKEYALSEGLGTKFVTWKPSIHMPKSVSRIFLKVTNVKIARLQDITEEESKKEGVTLSKYSGMNRANVSAYRCEFVELWNSTISKHNLDSYGWEANPYVWVIEFERVKED